MKGKTAVETLNYLIELLVCYLEEFNKDSATEENEFISGEMTAYIECLEIVQKWELAYKNGLDFDIEARFPI